MRLEARVDEHDDARRRAPDAGVQRGRVTQPGAGPDDLDSDARRPGRLGVELGQRRLLGVRRAVRDDDQLGAVGRAVGEGADGPGEVLWPVGRDEHDRGDAHRGVVETRRHRRARPVADDAGVDQVGCRGSLERVQRRRVDDLPAGGLDLRAQRVGRRPVPGPSRRGPRVGERTDLGGASSADIAPRGYRPLTARPAGVYQGWARSAGQAPPSGLIPDVLPA